MQHDVIQAMGAIAVRSAGATRTSDAEFDDALSQIEASARAALDGLRSHIGLLRQPVSESEQVPTPAPPSCVAPKLGRVDLIAAAAALPVAVETVLGDHRIGPVRLNVGLALLLVPPPVLRRRHPLPAVATGFAVAVVASLLATPPATTVSAIVPALLLSYGVGAHSRSWQARGAGAALVWAGVGLVGLATPPVLRDPAGLVPTIAWTGLAILGGVVAAGRADRVRARAHLLAEIESGSVGRVAPGRGAGATLLGLAAKRLAAAERVDAATLGRRADSSRQVAVIASKVVGSAGIAPA